MIYMKNIRESQRWMKFWQRTLFVICNCVTTLHSCYMKNALVFSQSDTHYLFLYIISIVCDNIFLLKSSDSP